METLPANLLHEAEMFRPGISELKTHKEPIGCNFKTVVPLDGMAVICPTEDFPFSALNYATILGATDEPMNHQQLVRLLENRFRRVNCVKSSGRESHRIEPISHLLRPTIRSSETVSKLATETTYDQIGKAFDAAKERIDKNTMESLGRSFRSLSITECLAVLKNGLLKLPDVRDEDLVNYMYKKLH
jgi:hypothetical protein